ncbi:hypothetical protein TYRP_014979 [Tyrophagus putrescentiae]|nr:hypothetical protein TYRP_014979 [Tyrophagus putrescentiae]
MAACSGDVLFLLWLTRMPTGNFSLQRHWARNSSALDQTVRRVRRDLAGSSTFTSAGSSATTTTASGQCLCPPDFGILFTEDFSDVAAVTRHHLIKHTDKADRCVK